MRLIPTKPRVVRIWSGGVTPSQFQSAKRKLRPLLEKVTAGKDLTPHLSDLVHKKGVILPGAGGRGRRQDIDMVLTRHGLHHFHVGVAGHGNPKGRSGTLVFAEVLEKEFRIVALSDHRVFEMRSAEQRRFFEICHAYMAKDIPPGQGFMANPVVSSGHSLLVTLFADRCDDEMRRLDPLSMIRHLSTDSITISLSFEAVNWWQSRTGHPWSGISKTCSSAFWTGDHGYFSADFHSSHDRTDRGRLMNAPNKRTMSRIDTGGSPQEFLWRRSGNPGNVLTWWLSRSRWRYGAGRDDAPTSRGVSTARPDHRVSHVSNAFPLNQVEPALEDLASSWQSPLLPYPCRISWRRAPCAV
jgi:hypothetical protein